MAEQMVASTADKMAVMMVYEWVAMWVELMVWQLVHYLVVQLVA